MNIDSLTPAGKKLFVHWDCFLNVEREKQSQINQIKTCLNALEASFSKVDTPLFQEIHATLVETNGEKTDPLTEKVKKISEALIALPDEGPFNKVPPEVLEIILKQDFSRSDFCSICWVNKLWHGTALRKMPIERLVEYIERADDEVSSKELMVLLSHCGNSVRHLNLAALTTTWCVSSTTKSPSVKLKEILDLCPSLEMLTIAFPSFSKMTEEQFSDVMCTTPSRNTLKYINIFGNIGITAYGALHRVSSKHFPLLSVNDRLNLFYRNHVLWDKTCNKDWMILIRLGYKPSEVMRLQLNEIDWHIKNAKQLQILFRAGITASDLTQLSPADKNFLVSHANHFLNLAIAGMKPLSILQLQDRRQRGGILDSAEGYGTCAELGISLEELKEYSDSSAANLLENHAALRAFQRHGVPVRWVLDLVPEMKNELKSPTCTEGVIEIIKQGVQPCQLRDLSAPDRTLCFKSLRHITKINDIFSKIGLTLSNFFTLPAVDRDWCIVKANVLHKFGYWGIQIEDILQLPPVLRKWIIENEHSLSLLNASGISPKEVSELPQNLKDWLIKNARTILQLLKAGLNAKDVLNLTEAKRKWIINNFQHIYELILSNIDIGYLLEMEEGAAAWFLENAKSIRILFRAGFSSEELKQLQERDSTWLLKNSLGIFLVSQTGKPLGEIFTLDQTQLDLLVQEAKEMFVQQGRTFRFL